MIKILRACHLLGRPAHAGVLGHPEQVAARLLEQHLRGDRQLTGRSRRLGAGGGHQLAATQNVVGVGTRD
jgi:hypothetical protein